MSSKPISAIAVFNDTIKGSVKFTEDLANDQIKIDLIDAESFKLIIKKLVPLTEKKYAEDFNKEDLVEPTTKKPKYS